MGIEDQCLGQFLAKVDLTHLFFNRNMSKSKGWTLQSSLLTLWMEKTQVNNQTKIAGKKNLLILFDSTTKLAQIASTRGIQAGVLNR